MSLMVLFINKSHALFTVAIDGMLVANYNGCIIYLGKVLEKCLIRTSSAPR